VIKNPNDIVTALIADFSRVFGEKLVNVTLYGSAVTHEFVPGRSSISLLIILPDTSLRIVQQGTRIHAKWMNRGVAAPLYLAAQHVATFAEIFPVEILVMQHAYRVLFGNDVLAPIVLCKENLLRQCERKLTEIEMHGTIAFIRIGDHNRKLERILASAVLNLLPVFKAFLVLFDKKIPNSTTETVAALEDLFGLGSSIFSDVYLRSGNIKGTVRDAYSKFYDTIGFLKKQLDNLEI
jgi:hypothetical protein